MALKSEATLQSILKVLREITWKLWNAMGWCTSSLE